MTRVEGMWESSIALLNPGNFVDGITYADGKLMSESMDIEETPFRVSINGSTEELTGRIILEYGQAEDFEDFEYLGDFEDDEDYEDDEVRRARLIENLVDLISPEYRRFLSQLILIR
jgi:antirestriction protein